MSRAALLIPFALALVLIIPITIGVYVYRDASRRRMNAALWTVVAVVAPSLIGFIIYLLVRGGHSDLECPRCRTAVASDYLVCPGCGASLRRVCPNCAAPVEPDWVACPKCAAPLPTTAEDIVIPVQRQDKSLWKILAAIIAIPLLLIALLGISVFGSFHGGVASMHQVSFDEYFQQQTSETELQVVFAWLAELDEQTDRAYALQYASGGEEGGYSLLIYVPGAGGSPHTSFGHSTGLLGQTLSLELEYTGRSDSLYCVTIDAARAPRVNVTVNGKKLPCEVADVLFDPTLPLP